MGRWNPSFVAISLPLPTCLGGTEFLELHSHDLETTSLFRTYEALCLIYVHALLPTLFSLSPRILWDVLSHQQGNVWTVKTPATLNGWMKVYHMLIFFVDLTKRPMTDHMRDYSAMLVRNPLLSRSLLIIATGGEGCLMGYLIPLLKSVTIFVCCRRRFTAEKMCTEQHCLLAVFVTPTFWLPT